MQLSWISWLVVTMLACSLALPTFSVPVYQRTMLPFPDDLPVEDTRITSELVQLQIYKDHQDPNQYYYIPPVHVRQYAYGAAGLVLDAKRVKAIARAEAVIEEEIVARAKYEKEYTDLEMARL